MANDKTLVYTVCRASTPKQVEAALQSLIEGQSSMGLDAEWLLWANSPLLLSEARNYWQGPVWTHNEGENCGQHYPLLKVLDYARANAFDYVVKVDADLEWKTKRWLKKLVYIEQTVYDFSKKHCLFAPKVQGLKNPIPVGAKIKVKEIPLLAVPIVGGACRLHHLSFFEDYVPDVRRALGAGGDTSIALHAEKVAHVGSFICPWIKVEHQTAKMEAADPEYYNMHGVFQSVPWVPVLKEIPNEVVSRGVSAPSA